FFFSSRRRHTRFSRDWSSDVCSSDLEMTKARFNMKQHKVRMKALSDQLKKIHDEYVQVKSELDQQTRLYNIEATLPAYQEAIDRSEERRVGKEGSCRLWMKL